MNPGQQTLAYSGLIVSRFLDILVGIVELLLGLRVILRFLAANAGSPFVAWVYTTTDQLLAPFAGMFPSVAFSGGYVIEFSTLFAMLAYAFIGWVLIKLVSLLTDELLKLNHSSR